MNKDTMNVGYAMKATDIEMYINTSNQSDYVRKIINDECLPPMKMIVRYGMSFFTVEQLDTLIARCAYVMTCYYNTERGHYKDWKYCQNRLQLTVQARKIPVKGRMAVIINKLGGRDIDFNNSLRDDELHQLRLECRRKSIEYCSHNVNPEYYIWLGLEQQLLDIIRDRVTVAMNKRMMCRVVVDRLTRELAEATTKAEVREKKHNDQITLVSGITDKIIRGKGGCTACIYHGTGYDCNVRSHLCHKGIFYFIPRTYSEQGLKLIKNKGRYCDKCYYKWDKPSCLAGKVECDNGKMIYIKE